MQIVLRGSTRRERGAILALTGIAMLFIVGIAALGIDVAHLAMSANEAQVVADAGATSGGRAMVEGDDVQTAVDTIAGDNTIDGDAVVPNELAIELGAFDFTSRSFTPGGAPANAVHVTATKDVPNFWAGALGYPTSTVSRDAIAAVGTLSSGEADLPLALSDCHFPPDCTTADCLPVLDSTPSTEDNDAWTGFFGGSNTSDIRDFFPSACSGSDEEIPPTSVGDQISLNNGQVQPALDALECMVCQLGQREFMLPVIAECDQNYVSASDPTNPSPNGTVVGFATITIDSFNYDDGGTYDCSAPDGTTPKSVNLSTVIRTEVGPPGAPCTGCGTFGVGLVG
jgi:hypothetical protein